MPTNYISARRELEWVWMKTAFGIADDVRYETVAVPIVAIPIRFLNNCFGRN